MVAFFCQKDASVPHRKAFTTLSDADLVCLCRHRRCALPYPYSLANSRLRSYCRDVT